jgi:hypothetical protein
MYIKNENTLEYPKGSEAFTRSDYCKIVELFKCNFLLARSHGQASLSDNSLVALLKIR